MNRPPRSAASTRGEGFTLVEVAVVIAMVGVLAAVAAIFVNPRSQVATARGYAQEVGALCDQMRQRAVASRKQQKLEVEADRVIHRQANAILNPTSFDLVGMVAVPPRVVIASFDAVTHHTSNQAVPPPGTGLPAEILFLPDGSSQAATIFIEDARSENRARVAVYPATGSAFVYYEW